MLGYRCNYDGLFGSPVGRYVSELLTIGTELDSEALAWPTPLPIPSV
jgi:hypothetical protein